MNRKSILLFGCLSAIWGCSSPVAPELGRCPQTYRFEHSGTLPGSLGDPFGDPPGNHLPAPNHGCARLLVFVAFPQEPWPHSSRFDLEVQAAYAGGEWFFLGHDVRLESTLITAVRKRPPPPGDGDTLSVWVRGWIRGSLLARDPSAVFASDSLLHLVRFSPVGTIPPVDTVHLALGRP